MLSAIIFLDMKCREPHSAACSYELHQTPAHCWADPDRAVLSNCALMMHIILGKIEQFYRPWAPSV